MAHAYRQVPRAAARLPLRHLCWLLTLLAPRFVHAAARTPEADPKLYGAEMQVHEQIYKGLCNRFSNSAKQYRDMCCCYSATPLSSLLSRAARGALLLFRAAASASRHPKFQAPSYAPPRALHPPLQQPPPVRARASHARAPVECQVVRRAAAHLDTVPRQRRPAIVRRRLPPEQQRLRAEARDRDGRGCAVVGVVGAELPGAAVDVLTRLPKLLLSLPNSHPPINAGAHHRVDICVDLRVGLQRRRGCARSAARPTAD